MYHSYFKCYSLQRISTFNILSDDEAVWARIANPFKDDNSEKCLAKGTKRHKAMNGTMYITLSERYLPHTSPLFLHTILQKSIIFYISTVTANIPKYRVPNAQQLKYSYNYRFPIKQGHSKIHTFTSAPSQDPLGKTVKK